MAKIKQHILLPNSKITFSDLLEIEDAEDRNTTRPTSLPLGDIHVAPEAFQICRDRTNEPEFSRDHIRALISALNEHETPLEHILVTPIGQRFFVVDGHHRYIAYKSVEWTRGIPIKIFEGTVSEAELAAGYGNHRDKLVVSRESKLEHAWTLVRRDKHSIAKIVLASGRSARTISNMRSKRKDMMEHKIDPWDYSWKGAQRDTSKSDDFDRDNWIEEKSTEMAQRICVDKSFKLVTWPEVLASAIEKVSSELPRRLVENWGHIALDVASQREQEYQDGELLDI